MQCLVNHQRPRTAAPPLLYRQGLVNKLTDYGIPEGNILGIRYGFRGFYDKAIKPIVLTKQSVDGIQLQGGTILGTSRGGANIK
jgi:6-phosphofructokinase 1